MSEMLMLSDRGYGVPHGFVPFIRDQSADRVLGRTNTARLLERVPAEMMTPEVREELAAQHDLQLEDLDFVAPLLREVGDFAVGQEVSFQPPEAKAQWGIATIHDIDVQPGRLIIRPLTKVEHRIDPTYPNLVPITLHQRLSNRPPRERHSLHQVGMTFFHLSLFEITARIKDARSKGDDAALADALHEEDLVRRGCRHYSIITPPKQHTFEADLSK
jgi:hypothetical protein